MMHALRSAPRGFTLIEMLTALLILSLLALMSYRGLGTVLDVREHVGVETEKWRRVAAFFARFERDVELASPRPARFSGGVVPAWLGEAIAPGSAPMLQFSRFASNESIDRGRRIGYGLNEKQEIELWLWPGLDVASDDAPPRHAVLVGVKSMELHYLDRSLAWVDAWPANPADAPIPRAVRLRIVLESGEAIVRVFALQS